MRKMILLGLLFYANVMDCSLIARLMPKIKLGAVPALLALGAACAPKDKAKGQVKAQAEQPKTDEAVSSYAEALAKYPFTTRLLMHRYKHFYNQYEKVKDEESGGFDSDTSSTGYRKIYRDYWKTTKVGTSRVILHSGSADYWLFEIDGTKAKPKKVASKLIKMLDAAPDLGNPNSLDGTYKKLDSCVRCEGHVEIFKCYAAVRDIPAGLKKVVKAEYQKQTGDLQRDVWNEAHKPTEFREYSLPATKPAPRESDYDYPY